MNLYCLSLKNIWKILIIEGIFSVLFCISMAILFQIAFFSYKAAFILGLAISLIYSLIIYFCGNFPLLLTIKGGIRYIEIAIIFFVVYYSSRYQYSHFFRMEIIYCLHFLIQFVLLEIIFMEVLVLFQR